jgi:hypothetical protein
VFESLRHNPKIGSYLQSIEAVEFAETHPEINLNTHFEDFLKACVAWRTENVPGFTLQIVDNGVQVTRLERYYKVDVCLFILCIMTYLIMPLGRLSLV